MSNDFLERFRQHRDERHGPQRDLEGRRNVRLQIMVGMMQPIYDACAQLKTIGVRFIGGDYDPCWAPGIDNVETGSPYRRHEWWGNAGEMATTSEIKLAREANELSAKYEEVCRAAALAKPTGFRDYIAFTQIGKDLMREQERAFKQLSGYALDNTFNTLCSLMREPSDRADQIRRAYALYWEFGSFGIAKPERIGGFPGRDSWRFCPTWLTIRVHYTKVIGVRVVFTGPHDNASWEDCQDKDLYRYEIADGHFTLPGLMPDPKRHTQDWDPAMYHMPSQCRDGDMWKLGGDLPDVQEWFAKKIVGYEYCERPPEDIDLENPDDGDREKRVIDLDGGSDAS